MQPISTVELPEFRELLLPLKPDLAIKDLPGRMKISELSMKEFEREKDELRARLKVCWFAPSDGGRST